MLALIISSSGHNEVRNADVEVSLLLLSHGLLVHREVALIYFLGSGDKSRITLSNMSSQKKKCIDARQI